MNELDGLNLIEPTAYAEHGYPHDLWTELRNHDPLRIICQILGVPREDEPLILRMTNELFGNEDTEFHRAEDRQTRLVELGTEMYEYFGPHLGFGIGEHFCLGANLARQTTGALFSELVPRLESIELVGTAERVASNLVPGFKHMPVRYRVRPRP